MKRPRKDAIDFSANPFVAFADFIMVTVVVVTLGFLSQVIFNKQVRERQAVTRLQTFLQTKVAEAEQDMAQTQKTTDPKHPLVARIRPKEPVGDLQRFSFDGSIMYTPGDNSTTLTEEGRKLITEFGNVLHKYEGDKDHPGEGLFKRLSVQGNCAPQENPNKRPGDPGDPGDVEQWRISQARSLQAAIILHKDCKINPQLIEATGRGAWDKSTIQQLPGSASPEEKRMARLKDRRLDIVIFYSGPLAVTYEKDLKKKMSKLISEERSAGTTERPR